MGLSEQADRVLVSPPSAEAPPSGAARKPGGENSRLRGLLDDAKRREQSARRALDLLNSIVDLLPVGVTVQAEDGTILLANDTAAKFYDAANPDVDAAKRNGGADDAVTMEERDVGADGDRTLLVCRRPVHIRDRSLVLSASLDFTERKRAEFELSKRAYFDDLTGLPNRALIQQHVEQMLASKGRPARFALAFLDIDNFKHINDYYTHAIGDALLVKVAERIADHIRPSDVLGRISGDEFLLVLHPLDHDDDLEKLINALLQQLKEPFLIEGFEILTSASIGVSVHPEHGISYEMLRRGADAAMYRVKAAAKGGAALFDSDMGRAMTVRMAHEQRLRLAVRDRRFCCAFQPKVDMRTQEVVGVEALIRLRDEDGVIQAPGEFVGLAIELGLIDDLTHLSLAEIVKSMALLDEAFGADSTISINVAAKQAGDLKFMAGFCAELSATNYAKRFMVEVTEDAFLVKSHFQTHVLPMLREIGTRVSVDDFGTGYSSLAALADITADEIKIDRSFITDIHQRPRSQSVLKAIEGLSDALGMTVIAEGVETFEEAAYLQAATRIRFAQGYYFAKPILLDDLGPSKRLVDASRSGVNARNQPASRGQRAILR
jgi:diguanylate cyclase (GGDEF)-like protein